MAHPDLDELLNTLFPFAEKMLEEHGAFHPFGASVSRKGDIALASGHEGSDRPASQAVIDLLVEGFREAAAKRQIRATGVCLDVVALPPGQKRKTDAVCARLEHETGEAVQVFLPYKKARRGKIEFGEVWGSPGEGTIF